VLLVGVNLPNSRTDRGKIQSFTRFFGTNRRIAPARAGTGLSRFVHDLEDMIEDDLVPNAFKSWTGGIPPPFQLLAPVGGGGTTSFALAVNMLEDEKCFQLEADVPGLSKENVKIELIGTDLMAISGEKVEKKETISEEGGQGKMIRRERRFGKFYRSFPVPENVDVDSIKAKCDAGVLTVTLPKKKGSTPMATTKQVLIE